MEDTGRIQKTLDVRMRRIFFGETVDQALDEELNFYVDIDRAHIVMLVEQNILPQDHGHLLLTAIADLTKEKYRSLRGKHAPRGLYLFYEQHLIDALGPEIGGAVHLGRSRNDMNATALRLRMRSPYKRLVSQLLRLIAILIRRSERYSKLTMPIYTHYQAALPITLGHYLCGVASALLRDLHGIQNAIQPDRCSLGAGAGGGTTIAIDSARSAQLLGFEGCVLNSVDAVASRDFVLHLLSAVAILGVTLSRLATDLLLWSTEEFGFIRLPDNLVGSSSMLPQKRNAFLLEHVKGRSAASLGAFTSAAVAMHGTPFSNSISVGTEGTKPLWAAMNEATDTVFALRLVLAGAEPCPARMHRRTFDGFTAATELANTLVQRAGLSFRQAHNQVGEAVRVAVGNHESFACAGQNLCREFNLSIDREWLDPSAIANRTEFGGGPAPGSATRAVAELRAAWAAAVRRSNDQSARWTRGSQQLEGAVASLKTPVKSSPIEAL